MDDGELFVAQFFSFFGALFCVMNTENLARYSGRSEKVDGLFMQRCNELIEEYFWSELRY